MSSPDPGLNDKLRPDDVRYEHNIRALLDGAGWDCVGVDDADDRYQVLGTLR